MKTLRRLVKDARTRVALMLAAGLGLLVVWMSAVDLRDIGARLSGLELRWVLLFALLWGAAAFTRSQRWRVILSRVEPVPRTEAFALFMSCMFVNFLVPLRLGEAVSALALKRNRGVPFAKSLPTQVMDRLFDLTPVVPALLLALMLMGGDGFGSLMAILAFVAFVFAVLTALVLVSMARPAKAAAIVGGLARFLPSSVRPRVEGFAVLCLEGLAGLRLSSSCIAMLVGMTFLALALDAASLQIIFIGLGEAISPGLILTGYTFLFLTSALPRPPGLVGSHEVLFLLIFSLLLGVDKNIASAAVVAGHVMLALLLSFTGALSLFALGIRSVSAVRDHLPSVTTTGAS